MTFNLCSITTVLGAEAALKSKNLTSLLFNQAAAL
jgi:hypothetical protein